MYSAIPADFLEENSRNIFILSVTYRYVMMFLIRGNLAKIALARETDREAVDCTEYAAQTAFSGHHRLTARSLVRGEKNLAHGMPPLHFFACHVKLTI